MNSQFELTPNANENLNAVVQWNNNDLDTDEWDAGDDNPANFGDLPVQFAQLSTGNPTTDSIIQFTKEDAGLEHRQVNIRLIREKGQDAFFQLMDHISPNLSLQVEELVVDGIQEFRDEHQVPHFEVSDVLVQAARSNSQYLCGNCVREFHDLPFHWRSYTVKRMSSQTLRWHVRKLVHFMKQSRVLSVEIGDYWLRELGVGVWGTSHSLIVTVLWET